MNRSDRRREKRKKQKENEKLNKVINFPSDTSFEQYSQWMLEEEDIFSSAEAQREKAKAYDHVTYVPENSEDKEDCRTMNWLNEGYEDWVRTEVDGKPICVCSISDESVYYAYENVKGQCFNHEGNEDCKWFGSFEDSYPPSCSLPLKLVEGNSPEANAMKEKIKKLDSEAQWFGRDV